MITKSYVAFCVNCTESTGLFGKTNKECIEEIKGMGWKKIKDNYYCDKCLKEVSVNELYGIKKPRK